MTTQPGGAKVKFGQRNRLKNVNHKVDYLKARKAEIRSKWKRSYRLLLMSESKIRYDLTYVMPTYHFQWILLVFHRWLKEQQFCHVLKTIVVITYSHYQFFYLLYTYLIKLKLSEASFSYVCRNPTINLFMYKCQVTEWNCGCMYSHPLVHV